MSLAHLCGRLCQAQGPAWRKVLQKCWNEKCETVKGKEDMNGSIYKAISFCHRPVLREEGPGWILARQNIPHPRRALKVKLGAIDQKSPLKSSQHLWVHKSPTDACVTPKYVFSSDVNSINPGSFNTWGKHSSPCPLPEGTPFLPPLPKEGKSPGPDLLSRIPCVLF